MRKVLYSFTLVFVLIFTLSSCGDEEHTHEFSEWAVTQNSTCTFDGTEERTCSCGEKETKPINALGHTEVVDSAVAATCTTDGKTEGKHCSVCNKVLVAQATVKANGHTEVIDAEVAATCTKTGLTEGKHCSVCNKVIFAQNEIPTIAHTYDNKYDEKCNVCGFERDANAHIPKPKQFPEKRLHVLLQDSPMVKSAKSAER